MTKPYSPKLCERCSWPYPRATYRVVVRTVAFEGARPKEQRVFACTEHYLQLLAGGTVARAKELETKS